MQRQTGQTDKLTASEGCFFVCVSLSLSLSIYIYIFTCIYIYTHMNVCAYVCIYIYIYMHMFISVFEYFMMDTFDVNPGATIPEPRPTLFTAESPLTAASVHCPACTGHTLQLQQTLEGARRLQCGDTFILDICSQPDHTSTYEAGLETVWWAAGLPVGSPSYLLLIF